MLARLTPSDWNFDVDAAASAALAISLGIAISYLAFALVFSVVKRLASLSESQADDLLVERIRQPIKWSFLAIGVTIVAQSNDTLLAAWEPLAQFLRPALLGWIAYNTVRGLTAAMELRLDASADPVSLRSRRTRIAVVSRVTTFAIVVITIGLMLYAIPAARSIGTTMLASAGIAALAIGMAAQPALKSLIAGVQVALTEPMRIGDLVKVDGETGRVEEIRMSYVTVRTWDERLIIIPTSRFLDESFENWSRRNEALTGAVFLHLDPAAIVAPIRAEFERFVGTHKLYDGRNMALLMTRAYPESVELRLSMSAATIGNLWDLRCEVREHMLEWLRENQPDALIRHRLELPGGHPKAGEPEAP